LADPTLTPALRAQQRDFVAQFLAPSAPSHQLLLASTGAGKTTTAMAVADAILRVPPARVLYVTPFRVLADQFALVQPSGSVLIRVSKAWLRERDRDPDSTSGRWPAWMLGTIDPHALADPWVIKELLTAEWDLVVVDDIDSLDPRAEQAVADLIAEGNARRLLALGRPSAVAPLRAIEDLRVTRWSLQRVGWDDLPSADQLRQFHSVLFDRSPEERLLLRRVQHLLDQVRDYSSDWGIDDLDQAASSSPYALQVHALQALERLRPQRNALAHGRTSEDLRNSLGRAAEFGQLTVAVEELQGLADAVDKLTVDSRQTAFTELLRTGPAALREHGVVVFCAQTSTADYIANGLAPLERPAVRIKPQAAKVAELHAALRTPDAVLVADDDTVIGVDLGGVRQAINYDLVPDPQRMLARWLRLGAADPRRQSPEVWTLIDRSQDSLPEQHALELMPYLAGV
jgi:hypothetical protein